MPCSSLQAQPLENPAEGTERACEGENSQQAEAGGVEQEDAPGADQRMSTPISDALRRSSGPVRGSCAQPHALKARPKCTTAIYVRLMMASCSVLEIASCALISRIPCAYVSVYPCDDLVPVAPAPIMPGEPRAR
jgi:hypothetical protein